MIKPQFFREEFATLYAEQDLVRGMVIWEDRLHKPLSEDCMLFDDDDFNATYLNGVVRVVKPIPRHEAIVFPTPLTVEDQLACRVISKAITEEVKSSKQLISETYPGMKPRTLRRYIRLIRLMDMADGQVLPVLGQGYKTSKNPAEIRQSLASLRELEKSIKTIGDVMQASL